MRKKKPVPPFCRNCEWARWQHLKNGSVNWRVRGHCDSMPPPIIPPMCISKYCFVNNWWDNYKSYITWTNEVPCPCWKAKDPKPKEAKS